MANVFDTSAPRSDETVAAVIHPGALKEKWRGEPIVHIDRLTIALPDGADRPYAVDRVSFKLFPGEMLCVVGESGSGKSMSANALMGLLPDTVRVAQGRILLGATDLNTIPADALYAIRGRRVAMIFQEPMSALNPLMKVSAQIEEVFEAHGLLTPRASAGERQCRF
jgi:peptide/nickel transport system ATP-binding protein